MKKINIWDILRWGLFSLFTISFIAHFVFGSLVARWLIFVFGIAFFVIVFVLEPRFRKRRRRTPAGERQRDMREDSNRAPGREPEREVGQEPGRNRKIQ